MITLYDLLSGKFLFFKIKQKKTAMSFSSLFFLIGYFKTFFFNQLQGLT